MGLVYLTEDSILVLLDPATCSSPELQARTTIRLELSVFMCVCVFMCCSVARKEIGILIPQ